MSPCYNKPFFLCDPQNMNTHHVEGYGQFQMGEDGDIKAKWFKVSFGVII